VGEPWRYLFYLDLRGSTREPKVRQALEELAGAAVSVRRLGCYPGASAPFREGPIGDTLVW
jgi:prephenate dehydratase